MNKRLIEAANEVSDSISALKETLEKQLNDKVNENAVVSKAIADNLCEARKIYDQRKERKDVEHRPPAEDQEEDFFNELAGEIDKNAIFQSKQSRIAEEIMEEFVFETVKPTLNCMREFDSLKATCDRFELKAKTATSLPEKLEALTTSIMTLYSRKESTNFAFVINESDLNFGTFTLQVS